MKYQLLAVFLILCSITPFYAIGYEKGNIVLMNNDTVKGYIKNQSDETMSFGIQFKTTLNNDSASEYRPNKIKSFGFDDSKERYYSIEYVYRTDTSQIKSIRLGRLIYSGSFKLYKLDIPFDEQRYVYESRRTYSYVIQKEENFFTLSQREVVTKKENDTRVTHRGNPYLLTTTLSKLHKDYVGILHYLLAEFPELNSDIDHLAFCDGDMIALMKSYDKKRAKRMK